MKGMSDERLQEIHTGDKLVKHIKGVDYYSQRIGPSGNIVEESLNLDEKGLFQGYLS